MKEKFRLFTIFKQGKACSEGGGEVCRKEFSFTQKGCRDRGLGPQLPRVKSKMREKIFQPGASAWLQERRMKGARD